MENGEDCCLERMDMRITKISDDINKTRPSIGMIIEDSIPIEIVNNCLILRYNKESGFNESLFNKLIFSETGIS